MVGCELLGKSRYSFQVLIIPTLLGIRKPLVRTGAEGFQEALSGSNRIARNGFYLSGRENFFRSSLNGIIR